MGRFLKMTVIAGVPFGLGMGIAFAALFSPTAGYVFALAGGPLFGLFLAGFAEWQRSRFTRDVPDLDGESLIKQGPANHFVGIEAVGGWLYLTDRRLLFRSHRFNVKNHQLSIPLAQILEARACMTARIVPNGLRVATAGGVDRFVVEGRRQWAEDIGQARGLLS